MRGILGVRMDVLRPTSYDEYACWYLKRERQKQGSIPSGTGLATLQCIRQEMRIRHDAKTRSWFTSPTTSWYIVLLESVDEIGALIYLASDWTRRWELVGSTGRRHLCDAAERAATTGYFDKANPRQTTQEEEVRRWKYYRQFSESWPTLHAQDRIVLCTPNECERKGNPEATYYLHDGCGRMLAYYYMIKHEHKQFRAVEAFLAEEPER
jgi:hypothetical protein